jgi:DNA-binding NtrC family response regulator
MKKIIIVEDSAELNYLLKKILNRNFPEANILLFNVDNEAIEAVVSSNKDFDVLVLDGYLGLGGHGENVLNVLTPEQLKKTIVFSYDNDFINNARKKGILEFMNGSFMGVRPSEIDAYILAKFKNVLPTISNAMETTEECSHECKCSCHDKDSRVVHIMACCEKCKICGKNIKIGEMDEHLKACHKNK